MSDETTTRYLHGARPNGSHCWAPFTVVDELGRLAARLGPVMPDDVVWDVTDRPYPPRPEETP